MKFGWGFRCPSGVFWVFLGLPLDEGHVKVLGWFLCVSWLFLGLALGEGQVNLRNSSGVPWLKFGCSMGVPWVKALGCSLGVPRVFLASRSGEPQEFLGCSLVKFGCPLDVPWVSFGCSLGVPCLKVR